MAKYVYNKHDANILCRLSDGSKTFEFRSAAVDKLSGAIISNGFTTVSDEDILALEKGSRVYDRYVKRGLLVVKDEIPSELKSIPEQLASAQAEIAALNAKIAELNPSKALEEATVEITALKKSNAALQEANADLEATAKELSQQLAEVVAELEEAKKPAPDDAAKTESEEK